MSVFYSIRSDLVLRDMPRVRTLLGELGELFNDDAAVEVEDAEGGFLSARIDYRGNLTNGDLTTLDDVVAELVDYLVEPTVGERWDDSDSVRYKFMLVPEGWEGDPVSWLASREIIAVLPRVAVEDRPALVEKVLAWWRDSQADPRASGDGG